MKLVIFESPEYDALYPLTYLRPSFELRCGYSSLAERISHLIPHDEIAFCLREYLAPTASERLEGVLNPWGELAGSDVLFVNGCWLPKGPVKVPKRGEVGVCGGHVLYARPTIEQHRTSGLADVGSIDELDMWLHSLPETKQIEERVITRPWNLVEYNPAAMCEDFDYMGVSGIEGTMSSQAAVIGSTNDLCIAPTAEVQSMAVIDTTHGPVFIAEGVTVFPFSRIEGPAYIGPETQIVGGNIREGCSIGPACRVGGEVEEGIIHGYSNKYHDGFLGHAYICEWVNLGALTTNSDLKNDYSNVHVYVRGQLEDSGSPKVGCFIGDHTKTSIGTFFNTGTIAGVMCVLVGSGGVLPKKLPSFCWYLNGRFYRGSGFKSATTTATKVTSRRGRTLSEADVNLLKHVQRETKGELRAAIKKSRPHTHSNSDSKK